MIRTNALFLWHIVRLKRESRLFRGSRKKRRPFEISEKPGAVTCKFPETPRLSARDIFQPQKARERPWDDISFAVFVLPLRSLLARGCLQRGPSREVAWQPGKRRVS
jgi:hypothetical protein